MNTLKFQIVTPEKVIFEKEVASVTIPTEAGEITVLPEHIPLISNVAPGELLIKENEKDAGQPFIIHGGFVEVNPDGLVILADAAERPEEIAETEVEAARVRAEEALKKTSITDKDYLALKAHLDREMARLRVSRKYGIRRIRPHDIKEKHE